MFSNEILNIDSVFLRRLISRWYPFSEEQINRYSHSLNWELLSVNPNVLWSEAVLLRFENLLKWGYGGLSLNGYLPWSNELVEKFISNWDRELKVSNNRLVSGACNWLKNINNHKLIDSVQDSLSYFSHFVIKEGDPERTWRTISTNQNILWTKEFIKNNSKNLIWEDTILLDSSEYSSSYYVDRFGGLCSNSSIGFNLDLIETFTDQISWHSLSLNEGIQWSVPLIKRFEEFWFYSFDNELEEIVTYNIPEYNSESDFDYCLKQFCFTANHTLPWSSELLEEFKDNWDWGILSESYFLPWSTDLIQKFKGKFVLKELVNNQAVWEKVFQSKIDKTVLDQVFLR
ncbi:MAG: hypothetical protein QNJ31_03215 [Candidatus Caenarcaniphilales bacterium]|nr:hypothetical protein [Candidatus Caenarcaniphilales bacterium]